jgi:hypothetical protein
LKLNTLTRLSPTGVPIASATPLCTHESVLAAVTEKLELAVVLAMVTLIA